MKAMPPLFLSPTDWDQLAGRLDDAFFLKLHEANERAVAVLMEAGESDLWCCPLDLRHTDRVRNDDERWRVLKHRLLRFSVSWRMTGSERALEEALRTVDALIDQRLWTVHYGAAGLQHGDLKTADLWVTACFALEALAPALDESRRGGLVGLLLDWALPAYLAGWEAGDWWRYADFNWGASVHGGAGLAALMLREVAPELSAQVLEKVREGLEYVLEAMPLGGGWIEGMMYQTTTLGHLTDFIAALHLQKGEDWGLAGERRLWDALDFRMRMLGGDGRPINFSNITETSHEWMLPHTWWWAARCGRPDWAGFAEAHPKPWWDTHGIFLDLEALWLRAPGQPTAPWRLQPGLAHAREIDWLMWRGERTWMAFRSGWNGGNHANLDLGQIIFGIDSERLLCDPGYGAGATDQHSCVTLRKKDQVHDTRAKIFRVREFGAGAGRALYLCCNLTGSFPGVAAYHYRHLLVGEAGYLLVVDDLMVYGGRRASARGHLQFRHRPVLEEAAFELEGTTKRVRGRFLTAVKRPEVRDWEWGGQSWNWERPCVYTMSYRPDIDAPHVRMAVLITELDPGEAVWEIDGDQAVFWHGDGRYRIDLAAGACVRG